MYLEEIVEMVFVCDKICVAGIWRKWRYRTL